MTPRAEARRDGNSRRASDAVVAAGDRHVETSGPPNTAQAYAAAAARSMRLRDVISALDEAIEAISDLCGDYESDKYLYWQLTDIGTVAKEAADILVEFDGAGA